MQDIWRILYTYGADVVLNGHDHDYERFALQTPDAEADPAHGIREFVVGTGGASLRAFRATIEPNSEARDRSTYGVLKLTLRPSGYDWAFVPIAGQTFSDAGSAACVAPEVESVLLGLSAAAPALVRARLHQHALVDLEAKAAAQELGGAAAT